MPRILLVALALAAVLLACASANKISVTSWCPVTIIGKCPDGCPAPQQVVLNYGDVRVPVQKPSHNAREAVSR